jgi:hypothetical protein
MMNWKGFGRKWSWTNFKVLPWNLPGETEKNYERTQSGQSVAGVENQTWDVLNTK